MAIKPSKPVVKVDSNPKPLNENQRLKNSFNEWAARQPSAQKNTLKQTIKVNSNPNTTPAKGMKGPTDSSIRGRGPGKYDWGHNEFSSKEGTGPYGEPTYDRNAPIKPIKVDSNPVPVRRSGLSGVSGKLGGQHAGGHGASLGGMPGMDLGGGGSFSRENM